MFLNLFSFIYLIIATLSGTWDVTSLARDWTHAPCIRNTVLTTEPPGKSWNVLLNLMPILKNMGVFVIKIKVFWIQKYCQEH